MSTGHSTGALLFVAWTLAGAAFAQPMSDINARSTAPTTEQREQRWLAAARAEGEVVAYSTAPPQDNKALTDAFTARYAIPVKLWRSSSEDILRRAVAEARAGATQADAFLNTGMGLEALHREKLLQPFASPYVGSLIPAAYPAHHEWVGVYLALMVQLYNTNLVAKADLPKSFEDLLAPAWKGKLGIEATDYDWFQGAVQSLGRDKGLQLFRTLVARNGVSVRKGHSLLANLVVAGEVPLGLTVYQFTAEQLRQSGAPVDWFVIPPAQAIQVGVGVTRQPKHPNAAMLFADFLISGAQDVLAARNFYAVRQDIAAKIPFPLEVQDAARSLDGSAEWEELYKKTFGVR